MSLWRWIFKIIPSLKLRKWRLRDTDQVQNEFILHFWIFAVIEPLCRTVHTGFCASKSVPFHDSNDSEAQYKVRLDLATDTPMAKDSNRLPGLS